MNANNNDRVIAKEKSRRRRAEERAIHIAARAERLREQALNPGKRFRRTVSSGMNARDSQIAYLRDRAERLRDKALERAAHYRKVADLARNDASALKALHLMRRAQERARVQFESAMQEMRDYEAMPPVVPRLPACPI